MVAGPDRRVARIVGTDVAIIAGDHLAFAFGLGADVSECALVSIVAGSLVLSQEKASRFHVTGVERAVVAVVALDDLARTDPQLAGIRVGTGIVVVAVVDARQNLMEALAVRGIAGIVRTDVVVVAVLLGARLAH